MKPSGWVGLVISAGLGATVMGLIALRSPQKTGWALACQGAPYKRLTPKVAQGLTQAGLQLGLRGWHPTVAWVNEQCEVMGHTRHQNG